MSLVLRKSTSLFQSPPQQDAECTGGGGVDKGPQWPSRPKRETLRLTSLDIVFIGPAIHFVIDNFPNIVSVPALFFRNSLYCVSLTGFITGLDGDGFGSAAVMATTGYIAGMHEIRIFAPHSRADWLSATLNALFSVAGMTLFLQGATRVRELTDPPLLINLIYISLWVRSLILSPGVCNICTIFNLCSWISVLIAAILSSLVYNMIQLEFHHHPFLLFLDMVVCSHLLRLVPPSEKEGEGEDNLLLMAIRSTVGWITILVNQVFRHMFLLAMVYVPLFTILLQYLGHL